MMRTSRDPVRTCRNVLRRRGLLVRRERDSSGTTTGYIVIQAHSKAIVGDGHGLTLVELMEFCGLTPPE